MHVHGTASGTGAGLQRGWEGRAWRQRSIRPVGCSRRGAGGSGIGGQWIGPLPLPRLTDVKEQPLLKAGLGRFSSDRRKVVDLQLFGENGQHMDVPVRGMIRVYRRHPENRLPRLSTAAEDWSGVAAQKWSSDPA